MYKYQRSSYSQSNANSQFLNQDKNRKNKWEHEINFSFSSFVFENFGY